MKILAIGLLTLGSISAFASNPGIGTYSKYKVSGNSLSGTTKNEITSFDESLQKFTYHYTSEVNGSVFQGDEILNADEMYTKEMNEMWVTKCESEIGGKLEEIQVPAGRFETCKVESEDGQITYLGGVPFGFVKSISKEGVLELVEFEYK